MDLNHHTLSHCGSVSLIVVSVVRDVGVHSDIIFLGRFLPFSSALEPRTEKRPGASGNRDSNHRVCAPARAASGNRKPRSGQQPAKEPRGPGILTLPPRYCQILRLDVVDLGLWHSVAVVEFAVLRYHGLTSDTIGQRSVKLLSHLRPKCRGSDTAFYLPIWSSATEYKADEGR
jgi:hypothetical protein